MSDQFSNLQNTVLSYQNKLQYAELKIRVLEERLRLVRIAKYGPGSEKLSDAQLELLELEPGVSSVEVQAESERPPVQPSTKTNASIRAAGTAREPSACRADPGVHAGAVRVPGLRQRNGRDRLRRQLATGCGAGEVLRAGHQAREARLQVVRGTWRGLGAAAATDHREVPGQ